MHPDIAPSWAARRYFEVSVQMPSQSAPGGVLAKARQRSTYIAEGPSPGLPETEDDVPVPQRTSALPVLPASPAVAQAQADAQRYATDVMTAFKKG